MKTVGERIKELRLEAGISLRQLASLIGVSATFLSQIENNLIAGSPTEERLKDIAKVLHIDPTELILLSKRIPSDVGDAVYQALLSKKVSGDDIVAFCRREKTS